MADDLEMRALKTVKRAQAKIQYQAALMDAYAEHVSVLEMRAFCGSFRHAEEHGQPTARPCPSTWRSVVTASVGTGTD